MALECMIGMVEGRAEDRCSIYEVSGGERHSGSCGWCDIRVGGTAFLHCANGGDG